MAILTEDMQRVVREQRLGYVATVCPDGTPNLSPKGTTRVWDDDHLVFADIRSPRTIANLKANPAIEINVVDWFTRKGYRFKGIATVIEAGPRFEELVAFYEQPGPSDAPRRIHAISSSLLSTRRSRNAAVALRNVISGSPCASAR